MPYEYIGTEQEFFVDCPGCDGTGKSKYTNNRQCINCTGKGKKTLKLYVFSPGDRVRVKFGFERMLIEMFGLDDKEQPKVTPRTVGVVHNVVTPDEHGLELSPTGIGVNVNFDGQLKKDGSLPKTREGQDNIDVWMFDLYELRAEK